MDEILLVAQPHIVSLCSIAMAFVFLLLWRRDRKEEILRREEIIREQLRHQRRMYEEQLQQAKEALSGKKGGGYIFIDLPEAKKALFHDLLIGFENYARLRDYRVRFSVDNTRMDKMAFKFTLFDKGVAATPQRVKRDLQEYLERVKAKGGFKDLPVVISRKEHEMLLNSMEVRIDFITRSYNLDEEISEFYNKMLDELFTVTESLSVEGGGYEEKADEPLPRGFADIRVASAFNELKQQIDALTQVIMALKSDSGIDGQSREKVTINLEKIKDELAEENEPDKVRIIKWLAKAMEQMEGLPLKGNAISALDNLCRLFGVSPAGDGG